MATKTYTIDELQSAVPPELMDELAAYLVAIENERLAATGWFNGRGRLPHL